MAVNVFQAGRFGNPRFEIWPASVPRRWIDFRGPGVETIQAMAAAGVQRCLEMGPGKVLAGLNKRIDKTLATEAVFDSASINKALTD